MPPDRAWGPGFKKLLESQDRAMIGDARHVAADGVQHDRPDPDVKDAWGMPAIRVTYKDHPDDLANARFLQDRADEVLSRGRARDLEGTRRRIDDRRAPARHLPDGQ